MTLHAPFHLAEEVCQRAYYVSSILPKPNQEENLEIILPGLQNFDDSPEPPSKGLNSPTPPLFAAIHIETSESSLFRSQTSFKLPKMPLTHNNYHFDSSGDEGDNDLDRRQASRTNKGILTDDTSHGALINPNISSSYNNITQVSQGTSAPFPSQTRKSSKFPSRGGRPSTSVQPSIENEGDYLSHVEADEEDEETLFEQILAQARDDYRKKLPPFVINPPKKEKQRTVQVGGGEEAEITFELWDKKRKSGFWVLRDGEGLKRILKYDSNVYQEWVGHTIGFEKEPIAWPLIKGLKSPKHRQEHALRDSSTLTIDDDEDSDEEVRGSKIRLLDTEELETGRKLRLRSVNQVHPYLVDRKLYDGVKKGKIKRTSDAEFEVDADFERERKRRLKPKSPIATPLSSSRKFGARKRSSKSRWPPSSSQSMSLLPATELTELQALVMSNTTLRTHHPDSQAHIPVYLRNIDNVGDFWERVIGAWKFRLQGVEPSYTTVKFPWLKPDSSILIHSTLEESYERMIETIRDAPIWRKKGDPKCEVDVDLIMPN